jgi:hypothetical protein
MKVLRRDEDGMGPLERGRKRYQEKDYKGAVEAFTDVSHDIQRYGEASRSTV